MGEAGHVTAQLRRALDAGNFDAAKMTAYGMPFVPLSWAVALTLLAAEAEPPSFEPMARRWLQRLLVEAKPTVRDFAIASQLIAAVAAGELVPSKALAPLEDAAEGKRLG